MKGQTASLVLQAGDAVERRAHHGAAPHRRRHPHRGDDRGRLLRRAREGLSARHLCDVVYLAGHVPAFAFEGPPKRVRYPCMPRRDAFNSPGSVEDSRAETRPLRQPRPACRPRRGCAGHGGAARHVRDGRLDAGRLPMRRGERRRASTRAADIRLSGIAKSSVPVLLALRRRRLAQGTRRQSGAQAAAGGRRPLREGGFCGDEVLPGRSCGIRCLLRHPHRGGEGPVRHRLCRAGLRAAFGLPLHL